MSTAWEADVPDDEWFGGLLAVIDSALVRVEGANRNDLLSDIALDHVTKLFWATASAQRLSEVDAKKSESPPA